MSTRIRPFYYSISIEGEDCNHPEEVRIEKHDNAPGLDDDFLDGEFNHFKTRKEAIAARDLIRKALQ